MRRLKLWLVIVAAVALVTASAAIAWHKHGRTHTDPVAATLSANLAAIKSKTCTGEDGPHRQFHGKGTGTANVAGDPRLKGTLKVHASGLINTTTGNGQVTGWLSIRGERSGAKARFWAVHSNGGRLNGFVAGWAHDRRGAPAGPLAGSGRLLGTLTGTLGPNGAFAAQIGAGGTAPVATANIQGGGCRNWHRKKGRGR
jgi:hypothetical protein